MTKKKNNFSWCEWDRVACVIAAIRQGETVYLCLHCCKCCPHFFFSQHRFSKPLFQGGLHWLHQSLIKSSPEGCTRASEFPPNTTTLDHFLCDIASDKSPAMAELFDRVYKRSKIFLPNHVNLASSRRHPCQSQGTNFVVMLRASSRCTRRVMQHVNRQT